MTAQGLCLTKCDNARGLFPKTRADMDKHKHPVRDMGDKGVKKLKHQ